MKEFPNQDQVYTNILKVTEEIRDLLCHKDKPKLKNPLYTFGVPYEPPINKILKVCEEMRDYLRDKEKPVHQGVFCNICQMQDIRGIRYKCFTCTDYDLCETCEKTHTHEHNFVKIIKPI